MRRLLGLVLALLLSLGIGGLPLDASAWQMAGGFWKTSIYVVYVDADEMDTLLDGTYFGGPDPLDYETDDWMFWAIWAFDQWTSRAALAVDHWVIEDTSGTNDACAYVSNNRNEISANLCVETPCSSALAATKGFLVSGTSEIDEVDICFGTFRRKGATIVQTYWDTRWSELYYAAGTNPTEFDFASVMLHEVGHAHRLGHSFEPNSVMVDGYVQPSEGEESAFRRRWLSGDDIEGVRDLFGRPTVGLLFEPGDYDARYARASTNSSTGAISFSSDKSLLTNLQFADLPPDVAVGKDNAGTWRFRTALSGISAELGKLRFSNPQPEEQ